MNSTNPRSWDWSPKLRWFAAEFLVVVTGVLVALALNALYQRAHDTNVEKQYIALLSRDVERAMADLDSEAEFEEKQVRDGMMAYRALSQHIPPADPAAVSGALQRLFVRRTLTPRDGTYRDLIATGNLRLIRNHALRDRVVDYFEGTQQSFEIINKNNSFFVDDMYNFTLISTGLILPRATLNNVTSLAQMEAALTDSLRGGYTEEPDRLWSLPASSPEWSKVKAVLLLRIRVATIAQHFEEGAMKNALDLKHALDSETKRVP